jgi:pimeloyl-ACP methyl ester carboxylesterase
MAASQEAGSGRMQVKTIPTLGYRTSYFEVGMQNSEVLVLLHDGAFGTTANLCWSEVAAQLAQSHHVYALDMVGWGGTDKVVFFDRPPFTSRVQQLDAFCAELGLAAATFIGVSFGATVLLRSAVARTSYLRPSQIIAISGTGGPLRKPDGIRALADFDTPDIAACRRITSLLVDDLEGLDDHVQHRFENGQIPGHWEAMSAPRLKNPFRFDPKEDTFLEDLTSVSIPITYIEGERDRLLERGWSRQLAELTPGGSSLVLDCAHEPNIDQPQELAKTLLSLL